MGKDQLVFVYNANSSVFSVVTDYVHKIVSPATYQCNLCMITYGNMGMKKEWKQFLQEIDMPIIFLHKDELAKRYPDLLNTQLPAVFITDKDHGISVLIPASEINKQRNIKDLIRLLSEKI